MSVMMLDWEEYEARIKELLKKEMEEEKKAEKNSVAELLEDLMIQDEYTIIVQKNGKEIARFKSYPSEK